MRRIGEAFLMKRRFSRPGRCRGLLWRGVAGLDALKRGATLFFSMKTISAQQAARQFDEYSQLAHDGEEILVTREGKPWVLLAPPAAVIEAKTTGELRWPDFAARLA